VQPRCAIRATSGNWRPDSGGAKDCVQPRCAIRATSGNGAGERLRRPGRRPLRARSVSLYSGSIRRGQHRTGGERGPARRRTV